MDAREWGWSCAVVATLLVGIDHAAAVQIDNRLAGDPRIAGPMAALESSEASESRLPDLRRKLADFNRERAQQLELRYEREGDLEKRFLERRFGVIQHRFRVSADPNEILKRWENALDLGRRVDRDRLAVIMEEITEGRYAAYYFFDAVLRPNVFASDEQLQRPESPIHEKVHLIQPSVYKVLGIECVWVDPRHPCIRSLEPVAVYLTEYAMLKRADPKLSDSSVYRAIMEHLNIEARRCGYPVGVARCPGEHQAVDYVLLPRQLARIVMRYGLEDGIRRFVISLAGGEAAAAAR